MTDKLKAKFAELAALTLAKCKQANCGFTCCSPEYCEEAVRFAGEHGEELHLPLLGDGGCRAAPHLRPLCSAHVCEKLLWHDPEFADKYFALREEVNDLMAEEGVM